MSNQIQRPGVGIGVFVRRDGTILLGKRKSLLMNNTWCIPGGHLEFNEEVLDCAVREVREETGLEIGNLTQGPYTNEVLTKEHKHYVSLFVISDYVGGEASLVEPDKFEMWEWFTWDKLPQPLCPPLTNYIRAGHNPFAI